MAGESTGTTEASPAGGAPAGDTGKEGGTGDEGKFKPVIFNTQESLDAAFSERATRAAESAKKEALKVFTDAGVSPEDALTKYNEWKTAEDAKKGPEAVAREAAEAAQRELAQYKQKEAEAKLATEVAKDLKIGDTPVPAELLRGSTAEEMKAHGEALVAFVQQIQGNGIRPPAYNPFQGRSTEGAPAAGDPLRNFFQTGQFT